MRIAVFRAFLTFCAFFWFVQLYAQDYSVTSIPEELKKGANSVVRKSSVTYSLGNKQTSIHSHSAITILNYKALDLAHLMIFYSVNDKLKIHKAIIYDAWGKKIKSIKRSEMNDYSVAANTTLYSDQRVIFSQVNPASYPITVEYEYEIIHPFLYGIKYFSPYGDNYQSVQNASFILENPSGIPVKFSTANLPSNVQVNESSPGMSWRFSNLPIITEEPLSPSFVEIKPEIRVAPERIAYDKYEGKADTWENYGRFLARLNSDDKGLSAETVQRLRQLTSACSTDREKVKVLYQYMQSRTHYINIAFGIGGIQPSPVSQVDVLGYGDCKDLSTYMIALLKAVDIDACYAVVKAGKHNHHIIPELTNHQFNHAIVCVPLPNDSLWLECTSQVMPFNFLGMFTDNRYALIVKDEGSKLVKTPEYGKDENYIYSSFTLSHSNDGASTKGTIKYGGLMMDDVANVTILPRKEQLLWIDRELQIPDFVVKNLRFISGKTSETSLILDLELDLKSYFSGTGNRLFVPLN
ncbi:MAG: DUF3857 domain-containing transglutaminase family protein, partial [Lentimicrobiaceae bacterium]|nr:DUF3857 domain-containing transglutaminase family protein [Lentimicrobiaceae bacterium]